MALFKIKNNDHPSFFCTYFTHLVDFFQFISFMKDYIRLDKADKNINYMLLNPLAQAGDTPRGIKLIRSLDTIKRIGLVSSFPSEGTNKRFFYFIEKSKIPESKATPILHDLEVVCNYSHYANLVPAIYHVSLRDILTIWKRIEHKTIPNLIYKNYYK